MTNAASEQQFDVPPTSIDCRSVGAYAMAGLTSIHLKWDHPTMATSTTDAKKRIVIPGAKPGDVFDIQPQPDGSYTLVRLQRPEPQEQMSVEKSMRAIETTPLSPTISWAELRSITREP